jgi:hypothetical protein
MRIIMTSSGEKIGKIPTLVDRMDKHNEQLNILFLHKNSQEVLNVTHIAAIDKLKAEYDRRQSELELKLLHATQMAARDKTDASKALADAEADAQRKYDALLAKSEAEKKAADERIITLENGKIEFDKAKSNASLLKLIVAAIFGLLTLAVGILAVIFH